MKFAYKTDIGRRRDNEDSYLIPKADAAYPLFAVADGMGGHAAGDVASRITVETIAEAADSFCADTLKIQFRSAVLRANSNVYRLSNASKEKYGMGSTVVAAIVRDDAYLAANVGDSRLYHFHDAALTQITKDHSYVQMLVDGGDITPEEAKTHPQRNLITRAIGVNIRTQVDLFEMKWCTGDQLLLCSDGLHGAVSPEEIVSVLSSARTLDEKCGVLVELALKNGGTDNITVILILNDGGADV